MTTKSSDGGQTFLDTEQEAIDYLTQQFPGQDTATLVATARGEQVAQEENPDLWWDGIDRDELVAWIKNL